MADPRIPAETRIVFAVQLPFLLSLAVGVSASALAAEERGNLFGDPVVQVTAAIATCPPQHGPMIAESEMRTEAHSRAERGTRCYQSGQCRLPNAYLYDREIIPRVRQAILYDGRFADSSIWIEGQRRWVWLKGCVSKPEQALQIEQLVRHIDDVESVINELTLAPR